MPICIECRYPVPRLYRVLHSSNTGSRKAPPINRSTKPGQPNASRKGDTQARSKPKPAAAVLGGDVRLTQCPQCKRFADKYVEHDYVVLFIDLVLVKPQVWSSPFSHVVIFLYVTVQLEDLVCVLYSLNLNRSTGISSLTA